MAKSANSQGPVQRRKDKDDREWTTPEEKTYLQSKQAEYSMARDKKVLKAWFTVELKVYFDKFPTQPVTEYEKLNKGSNWSFKDKRAMEDAVSDWRLDGNYDNLLLTY